jgi:hypothetical protein
LGRPLNDEKPGPSDPIGQVTNASSEIINYILFKL